MRPLRRHTRWPRPIRDRIQAAGGVVKRAAAAYVAVQIAGFILAALIVAALLKGC